MTPFKTIPVHHKHQLLLAALARLGGGKVSGGSNARHDQGASAQPPQIANLFNGCHFSVNRVKVGAAATSPSHGPIPCSAQHVAAAVVHHGKMVPRVELQLLLAHPNLIPQLVQIGPSA